MRLFLFYFSLLVFGQFLYSQTPFKAYENATEPVIFYPGVISTNSVQWNNAFDKYGNFYYTLQGKTRSEIVMRKWGENGYAEKSIIPLDTNAIHSDVWVNQVGNRLIFMSTYNPNGNLEGFNLWESKKKNNAWQAPKEVSKATSSAGGESYPWLSRSGNLYFSVARDNSRNSDIYVLPKGSETAKKLPSEINTDTFEGDAFIAPDESYIIFAAFGRPEGGALSELFIAFKTDKGWTKTKWMGAKINSDGYDGSPVVTADGKFLVFTSSRASLGQNITFFNHYIVRFNADDWKE